ncbi:MAG: aminoglycoside phosphotransferase family protein [Gammaproteobacteria bacterium]|nr:aminoglycoside phosphotransferase family protein [Gammaproteobacteria bacterium]
MRGPANGVWRDIAARFDLAGRVADVRPYGSGLINTTLLIETDAGDRAILQRLNRRVFPRPELIQANLRTLHDHLGEQGGTDPAVLKLPLIISTRDGDDYLVDAEGEVWRALAFIDSARSFGAIEDDAHARETGRALGCFHAMLSTLDPRQLHDTLPGFHVTPGYLANFDTVLAGFDGHGEEATLRVLLDFVAERRVMAGVLEDARRAGLLGERVIHGDPKLDNVLFDVASGRALALIDLDTVKPGLIHYDLGDCLRSTCNRAGEAGEETVEFDLALCRSVLSGYLAEARAFLTETDIAYLFDAIRLLPFELGLRFLTDHLAGDVYFHVSEPGENLRRAQVQFRLVESIERQESAIRSLCGAG